jgi:hypothetical protein
VSRHPVVHYTAVPDGAVLAASLIEYLNKRRLRARVNEAGEVAVVWELSELDQLDAFLRDMARTHISDNQPLK